jgi:thiol-disulfide isomerase/thioredoxin
MRTLILFFVALAGLYSCKEEPKDYVTISGKIANFHPDKTLTIFMDEEPHKVIALNDDGSFKDTLKVEEARDHKFKHGDEYGTIYLKNNNASSFTTDYEDFDNKLVYEGDDADNNNFGIALYRLGNNYFSADMFNDGTEEDIDKAITDYKAGYENLKLQYKNVDSLHLVNGDLAIDRTIQSVERYFKSKMALREAFPTGMPSPTFVDYENHKGGTTSLKDLKGKFVYIDVWATWCGPCKREIPSLKEVEHKYRNKNIEFVSISVDDERRSGTPEKAYESWRTMVTEKELTGIQLFADKAWQSDFIKAYQIHGIPRFILIDPDGNIVSADAPRPSNPKLIALFDKLNM